MLRDMTHKMMRLLVLALLMMVSMGAWAQGKYVTVNLGADSDGQFTNGTIVEAGQEKDGDEVTVTLTVTPASGYTFNKTNATVYATISTNGTRSTEISKSLTLDGPEGDVTKATDYTVTVDANLGVWVQSATFNKASSSQKGPQQRGTVSVNYYYLHCRQSNNSGYYLVPAYGYYNDNYDMPYLTTYQTGKDANSIWRVEKVNLEGDEQDYYRFIHNATGKYITANDALSGFDAGRFRFHLQESSTPDDAMLFILKEGSNGRYAIRSKDNVVDNGNDSRYWWDMAGGNKNNYWAGLTDQSGILGMWNVENATNCYNWELVPTTATCATPIITYNEAGNTFSISYPISSDGATIHYTTDGTEPTASSATYSSAINGTDVTTKLRAIAIATGYNNSAEAMVYGSAYSATPHLFKTIDAANQSYYLISPVDDSDANAGRNYLTTSNVPNPRMQWLIKPASSNSNIQYYYLVNSETGKCVYFTGTAMNQGSTFVVKSRDEDGAEADRFMFRIWEGSADGISYLNFSPKMISYALPTQNQNNMLTKQNATDHTNPTGVYRDDNTGGRARWQMVDVPADPKSISALPETMVSNASNSVYFKLRNAVQTNSTDYFVYPPTSAAYATAATTGTNPEWYFVEATDADTWNTYYNIRNAQTGHYLYFDGTTKYNDNNNKFLTSEEIVSGSEDKYKFLVLKTANTTYSGTYHIVPKEFRNNNNQANIALNRNSATLRTYQSRGTNASCWYLDAVSFKCAVPTFQYTSSSRTLTITCSTEGADIYYAIGTTEPAISDANKYTSPVTLPEGSLTVTAIAVRNADASDKSDAAAFSVQIITSGDQITDMSGFYYLGSNFTQSADPIGTADNPFCGTIDGQLNTFSISHPLFGYVENAVIKNIILDNVSISSGDDEGNTGAIACVAKGTTRIYNCGVLATTGSSVSGSKYVGGLVGLLDGEARVINCYSFANISGGTHVGGIVGYNNYASKSDDIRTMVMNCMMYGNITGGDDIAPVYNGLKISNLGGSKGLNNYNYFSYEDLTATINTYNCALGVEKKSYLQRFEFYRNILNSNRELACWYATGSTANARQVMAKWVLETADRNNSNPYPYPILKAQGKYPSIVNIDAEHATTGADRNKGGKLGTLTVYIQDGSGGAVFSAPSGAGVHTATLTLNITDKDEDRYNYNYRKVQLPYYNDVGNGNYTGNRVVTGWKIMSVSGNSNNTFTKNTTYPEGATGQNILSIDDCYNFADRTDTGKDLYGTSGRVFAQGAYYDVPDNVTSITIQPYWAKCTYLSDANYDVTYNTGSTATNVTAMGTRYTNDVAVDINGSSQKVYTSMSNALSNLGRNASHTVYDYAVVFVGNYHHYSADNSYTGNNYYNTSGNPSLPVTIMSADLDNDNEPDNVFFLQHGKTRIGLCPIRYDFLCVPDIGMAQKADGLTRMPSIGAFWPYGWFETTNTSLMHFTQIEYATTKKVVSPLILQGGIFESVFTSFQGGEAANGNGANNCNRTNYIHIGGNAYFEEFSNGSHVNNQQFTTHVPISVTGGECKSFYLSGMMLPTSGTPTEKADNAEGYIDGGKFGEVASGGMLKIDGNVTWIIYNADIDNFYGGGINANKTVTGNISTTMRDCHVTTYCGGPKFGNMSSGKTVTSTINGGTFGTFYGAGYGGTALAKQTTQQNNSFSNQSQWDTWADTYDRQYKDGVGIATRYEFLYFQFSGGSDATQVGQMYTYYASMSLAQTNNVTTTMTGSEVTGNFYGGGSLGKVFGNVNTTLTDCTVGGNVFGAGFSATTPTVEVMNTGRTNPRPTFDSNAGVFTEAGYPSSVTYTWKHAESVSAGNEFDTTSEGGPYILTTVDLGKSNLGSVDGNVILTIDGSSTVTGNVFGGGESSYVTGNDHTVTVNIQGNTQVLGNVFGGGDKGKVEGSTTVNIE